MLKPTQGLTKLTGLRPSLERTSCRAASSEQSGTAVAEIVAELEGAFYVSQLKGYWGERPLVLRNAFGDEPSWPSWNDIVQLSCWNNDEDDTLENVQSGESARLIQHIPGKLETFDLDLGPFDLHFLEDIMSSTKKKNKKKRFELEDFETDVSSETTKKDKKWTLVLNDVDRWRPALADWMDRSFPFLPRWRRDDAQISLAAVGGGIGPHVDNYDVFLIQISGQREWLVGSKLSLAEEREKLVPDISVSILQLDSNCDNNAPATTTTKLLLNAGDMLYLPPRVVHWGTAVTDDCMTLSVGCRAPSAADLVARVAESVQMSVQPTAVERYKDDEDFLVDNNNDRVARPSLSAAVKETMKDLVRNAVENLLQDDAAWDELVGKMTTEALRFSEYIVQPDSDTDEYYRENREEDSNNLLKRLIELGQLATLVRAPGISIATSQITTDDGKSVDRLFANGSMWEVSNDENAAFIFRRIERGEAVDGKELAVIASVQVLRALAELLEAGVLQAHKML